jgi:hypothetical protein
LPRRRIKTPQEKCGGRPYEGSHDRQAREPFQDFSKRHIDARDFGRRVGDVNLNLGSRVLYGESAKFAPFAERLCTRTIGSSTVRSGDIPVPVFTYAHETNSYGPAHTVTNTRNQCRDIL